MEQTVKNRIIKRVKRGIDMNTKLSPAVFAVNQEYHIMLYEAAPSLMWISVGGKKYYDESNGILRSNTQVHRVIVPMEELDGVKEYTVFMRKVIDRKPYFPEFEDVLECTYEFQPVGLEKPVRAYHISDTHNWVEGPVTAAKAYGEIDFLIMNGDIPDHSGCIENCITIYKIASEVTGGRIPIVFARGNHDMRGLLAERFCELTPTDNGKSYYTFRIGNVWGMILDCGEDKVDKHEEYGGTICCHEFREKQTKFIEKVICRAEEEYLADNVKYRLVIAHNPFVMRNKYPFDIENEIYSEWVRLINDNIRPTVMISGHTHSLDIIRPQDEKDAYGQSFSVVVGSSLNKNQDYYAGAGLAFDENETIVTFTDSFGKVVREEKL